MKEYRIILNKKQVELLEKLVREEFEALIIASAAESSRDFVGEILDILWGKLNPNPKYK